MVQSPMLAVVVCREASAREGNRPSRHQATEHSGGPACRHGYHTEGEEAAIPGDQPKDHRLRVWLSLRGLLPHEDRVRYPIHHRPGGFEGVIRRAL